MRRPERKNRCCQSRNEAKPKLSGKKLTYPLEACLPIILFFRVYINGIPWLSGVYYLSIPGSTLIRQNFATLMNNDDLFVSGGIRSCLAI